MDDLERWFAIRFRSISSRAPSPFGGIGRVPYSEWVACCRHLLHLAPSAPGSSVPEQVDRMCDAFCLIEDSYTALVLEHESEKAKARTRR